VPCHVSPQRTPCLCCSDHRRRIDQLLAELDAERAAAATAAAESMAMIRRLQREKSDAMLESRQFKRFSEEQMARYRYEIEALEEVLAEKEETIFSLSNELEDCKKVFDDMPQWVNYTVRESTVFTLMYLGK
jgi:glycine cleavage system pyridoxal-binding protein P